MSREYKNILLSLCLALVGYFLAGLTFDETQSRLVGIVVLLVALWTNEALPLGVVSLLPIVLFPSFEVLTTGQTTANYSKSIIFLFLGGFLLAIAVEKIGLHKVIANKTFKRIPKQRQGDHICPSCYFGTSKFLAFKYHHGTSFDAYCPVLK